MDYEYKKIGWFGRYTMTCGYEDEDGKVQQAVKRGIRWPFQKRFKIKYKNKAGKPVTLYDMTFNMRRPIRTWIKASWEIKKNCDGEKGKEFLSEIDSEFRSE